ncbi:hypothetical protein [Alteromonas sp. ALT199]|uniref:hypothetical protein n=1 Tax=unclassified Alteromonas TaxID=2614992 RepID=UPI000451E3B0|nr:hypothetical protein [Alteromonas sp. ALT199]
MSEITKEPIKVQSKFGEYGVELKGNIIRLDGKGVVTKALFQLYHEDVKKLALPLGGQPWGFLIFVQGVGILTPDAEQALIESVRLRKQYGMQGCAFVTSDADIPALVKSQFERVYAAANLACYFSDSENDALTWLAALGCSFSTD